MDRTTYKKLTDPKSGCSHPACVRNSIRKARKHAPEETRVADASMELVDDVELHTRS